MGWLLVTEAGHYYVAGSEKDKFLEHTSTSNNVTIKDDTINADGIVQEVLSEVIDSILHISGINGISGISGINDESCNNSPVASSNLDDITNPIDITNDDILASDFNRNLIGSVMIEKGASSLHILEAYKVYTLFWCKELVNLNEMLNNINSNASYIHVLMAFDDNRVHFEVVLAIIVTCSYQRITDNDQYHHVLAMASILSAGINNILSKRMLAKHHINITKAIVSILKDYVDSSKKINNNNNKDDDDDTNGIELQLINCSLSHGSLLLSVDSLKEGIKHMQRTIVIVYDLYSKHPNEYQDKAHLSSAFFIIFEMLDKKVLLPLLLLLLQLPLPPPSLLLLLLLLLPPSLLLPILILIYSLYEDQEVTEVPRYEDLLHRTEGVVHSRVHGNLLTNIW